ncbi:PREDICTED: GDP-fucose protein O-fucosyltransferase 1 [Polistes dominula]|uniref:GDP-fucose protein O-fucosyltransferase 1 n=1 Tax=Polistes dominula TaxID=743375 RepID=A0ABM1J0S2_POLDO|nr:PREDICTED: GDP-fucose protein O-fucosyltransferase 1 [Polistes dominula]
MYRFLYLIVFLITIFNVNCQNFDVDINGYILYCPCMGRFGNQADHFLGALGFAIALNRTLVLPPWVEYRTGQTKSIQVPFDTYFNVSKLQECHKTMLMHDFMDNLAPTIWPLKERVSFCYSQRGNSESCNAKEGNPFGPFWDTYNIDFVNSEFYGPLHYDVYHTDMVSQWKQKYPSKVWPILAFTGAPASFPVQFENTKLHKCLEWNESIQEKAKSFVKNNLPKGAYIGIHLRNGIDWVRACEYTSMTPNLFAAAQCLGYRNERGKATTTMCLPPFNVILRHIKRIIRNHNEVKSIFVASDNNYMIDELTNSLARMQVQVFRQPDPVSPHVDLAILGRANYFIGNCISSFSAFVARERQVKGYPTYFWGFPPERSSATISHEEL